MKLKCAHCFPNRDPPSYSRHVFVYPLCSYHRCRLAKSWSCFETLADEMTVPYDILLLFAADGFQNKTKLKFSG